MHFFARGISLNSNFLIIFQKTTQHHPCSIDFVFDCLTPQLRAKKIFLYFDEKNKYRYAQHHIHNNNNNNNNNNQNQTKFPKQLHAFLVHVDKDLIFNIRSFVINILQNSVEAVIVIMKQSLFDLLMDVWLKEGFERTVSWLHVNGNNRVQYRAPKCNKFFEPDIKPLLQIPILTTQGTWWVGN